MCAWIFPLILRTRNLPRSSRATICCRRSKKSSAKIFLTPLVCSRRKPLRNQSGNSRSSGRDQKRDRKHDRKRESEREKENDDAKHDPAKRERDLFQRSEEHTSELQ